LPCLIPPLCKQRGKTRLGNEVGDNRHDCQRRRWTFVDPWHAQNIARAARWLDLIRQRSQVGTASGQLTVLGSNEHVDGCLDISARGVHSRDYSRVPGALELVKPIPVVWQFVGLEYLDVDLLSS
jgi:hypothetical protein